jgi:hypothetical protein
MSEDNNIVELKYYETLKRFDICHDILSDLSNLYGIKMRNNISDEPKEFFDKLDTIFQRAVSNFDEAKKSYLKAKSDYDKIKGK